MQYYVLFEILVFTTINLFRPFLKVPISIKIRIFLTDYTEFSISLHRSKLTWF